VRQLKRRTPIADETIEVQTTDDEWHLCQVGNMWRTNDGPWTMNLHFMEEPYESVTVNPDDIQWRRPPQ